jgi:hypothetical protein
LWLILSKFSVLSNPCKDLIDEWKQHGLEEGVQFASLTDVICKTWAGKTAKGYKQFKGLKKEARLKLETETGKAVVTPLNAKTVLQIETPNKEKIRYIQ